MKNPGSKNIFEKFKDHYEKEGSDWGNSSGPGSNSFYTIEYRAFISNFIHLNDIEHAVDVGCGDWQFSRYIDFGNARYTGFDVVESVIDKNNSNFSSEKIKFFIMPNSISEIPKGDLLIMKDVLQHLPDKFIFEYHKSVLPNFRFSLLTNSYKKLDTEQNIDVPIGSFRCLDLSKSPYNFDGTYILEFGSSVWERIRVFFDPLNKKKLAEFIKMHA